MAAHCAIVLLAFVRSLQMGTDSSRSATAADGGSTGSPTEAGLIADAEAAYAFAAARYPAERIVLWGESLGSGVAIALGAGQRVGRIVLEGSFTSAADVGAAHAYRFLPVRLLMKDQFRSDLRIARVTAPLLFLHGGRDWVVPIALGERLYALANEPKQFVRFSDAGHEYGYLPPPPKRNKGKIDGKHYVVAARHIER
jgi:fermentation-respiration switch protein FrsA (DUF1100 family)